MSERRELASIPIIGAALAGQREPIPMPPSPGFAHIVTPEPVHTGNKLPDGEMYSILVRTHEFANRYDWNEWGWSAEGEAWYVRSTGREATPEQLAAVTHWMRDPVRLHWLSR